MRLIDADHLKAWVLSWWERTAPTSEYIKGKDILDQIDREPTIEPMEWIPCSERLPEENVVVLTQAKFKDDIKMAVSVRQDYNYWTGWGTREVNIVAWMPLPPAWKGADDE